MDRRISAYGPSVVVLFTVALVILAGPYAIGRLTYARTQRDIELASHWLESDQNILEQINQAHRAIATKVEPSVVYISTEHILERNGRNVASRLSSGSGWIYDEDGHVVTNAHVIDGASRVEVQLHTGELRRAELVGRDVHTDVAVLRIAPGELHPAHRSETPVQQGDVVFAFGSPFDFRFSMSSGIVSGEGRQADIETVFYQNFIQTDAAINPGNSGGPLTDSRGHVIGMNTAIATGRQGSPNDGVFSGIGLAIPIDMIDSVVPQLIQQGEVKRGFLGVELWEELSLGRARQMGFVGDGVEVRSVTPGSPAERAGLQQGDVITAVDSRVVGTLKQIQSLISSRLPGQNLVLTVWRYDGVADRSEQFELNVTLTEMRPEQMVDRRVLAFLYRLGFNRLETATETRATALGVQHRRGVIVEEVVPRSAIEQRIPPGSIITHVFGDPVQNLDEFYSRFQRAWFAMNESVTVSVVLPNGSVESIDLRPY